MLKMLFTVAMVAACVGGQSAGDAMSALDGLPHGLYAQSAAGWTKLEIVTRSGTATKHGGAALVGVVPGTVFTYAGTHAAQTLETRRPVFGIRVDPARPDAPGFNPRDLLIVRMAVVKDHRELQVVHGGFASVRTGVDSKDITELKISEVADRTYTATATSDLKPGEYLVTFRGANGAAGYEFGVK
jgi:hypothetical protein